MTDQVQQRKDDHLRICLEEDVGSEISTGLSAYRLEYDALPEVDLDEIDLSVEILGKKLSAPLIIGAMTGGSELAGTLNHSLAKVAARAGIGMALGSQRAMLKDNQIRQTYAVRESAPDLPLLLGNIGAVQLRYGVTVEDLKMLVESVDADALYFHLNPLQEAIQPEGDTNFAGLIERMTDAMNALPFPSLVKEVGAGISPRTAKKLATLPVQGVEASGVGGTSWARVEAYRAAPKSLSAQLGHRLKGFGIPTAQSIQACRQAFAKRLVIGSGGIRTGMDIAVAIALGADAVAMARPLLESVTRSEEAAEEHIAALLHELRLICFCTGAKNIKELQQVRVFKGEQEVVINR